MNLPPAVVTARARIAHWLGLARSARYFRRGDIHTYYIRRAWKLRKESRNAKPSKVV